MSRRIAYPLAEAGIARLARKESIPKDQLFSGHAPGTVDYEPGL